MSLRMVEAVIPKREETDDDSLFEGLDVIESWEEAIRDDKELLRILVRSEKTESLLERLSRAYGSKPGFRVILLEVEGVYPHLEDPKKSKPSAEPEGEAADQGEKAEDPQRIACAELVQKLSSLAAANRIYFVTVILSTVVATVGLMHDNVAVIIGAMVIAPLLGPNMTLALATTLGDRKLAKKAIWVTGSGFALSIFVAVLTGFLVTIDITSSEISSRTAVGLSDIVLALAAGSAGALAFTTGLSAAVVGVMVAVALLPPLATSGLLLGAGEWELALGALLLTATNVVCINFAAVATFLLQNVRPTHWWEARNAKKMVRVAGSFWLILLCLLAILILLTQQ